MILGLQVNNLYFLGSGRVGWGVGEGGMLEWNGEIDKRNARILEKSTGPNPVLDVDGRKKLAAIDT